jgi:hypothetical protein
MYAGVTQYGAGRWQLIQVHLASSRAAHGCMSDAIHLIFTQQPATTVESYCHVQEKYNLSHRHNVHVKDRW